jgi:acyl carrier protein
MAKHLNITTCGCEISGRIRDYISNHFLVQFDKEMHDETDLFATGVIDSFGYIELIAFLEKTFNFHLNDSELTTDTLKSIVNIVKLIKSKADEK